MSDELFSLPPSPSPRLQWLERYGLALWKDGTRHVCGWDADNNGRGDTDDEACIDFCLKYRVPHWTQTS